MDQKVNKVSVAVLKAHILEVNASLYYIELPSIFAN
jgi:hypothetical protein